MDNVGQVKRFFDFSKNGSEFNLRIDIQYLAHNRVVGLQGALGGAVILEVIKGLLPRFGRIKTRTTWGIPMLFVSSGGFCVLAPMLGDDFFFLSDESFALLLFCHFKLISFCICKLLFLCGFAGVYLGLLPAFFLFAGKAVLLFLVLFCEPPPLKWSNAIVRKAEDPR